MALVPDTMAAIYVNEFDLHTRRSRFRVWNSTLSMHYAKVYFLIKSLESTLSIKILQNQI